jgi:hypothetical protein
MKGSEKSVGDEEARERERERDRTATVYQTLVSSLGNFKRGFVVACSNMASSENMRYRINCTARGLRRIIPLTACKHPYCTEIKIYPKD